MMRMPKGWRTGAIGLLALVSLAACVVGGYDGGGYEEGYVGGVYAEGGYDYGGWGPGYRVGPPGWSRGPGPGGRPDGGGRPPPSIPHGARGGGAPHGGGGGRPGH
jgi:hypothetical protein